MKRRLAVMMTLDVDGYTANSLIGSATPESIMSTVRDYLVGLEMGGDARPASPGNAFFEIEDLIVGSAEWVE